ncbi:sigma-70 family RNA polymerase sigma factor [Pedobacter frigoris]|uniref:Sigma-70 family RNA polymerase sigma factor n=1 Tax=Pedobacter frigoris TaxID=2571272 RepID=A0A4V5P1D0_9SPHI|nr:sigma-70 family RNA polymerase sigma factor [Pedobacter frigoris]TKC09632.1 sigma-70 family RNA polymerase sigma factor [Pedobacter frigoris]
MNTIDFNRHLITNQNALESFAFKFTHDYEDANDLVQDTMLKAMRYSQKFKEGTNFKGWLYTIMKNTFINGYRRTIKTRSLMSTHEEIPTAQFINGATRNSGENKFMMEDINNAMNKLQPEYLTPFIKYFEGFKYHEIAEELNIPIGTVKTRIHMARGLLKKNLKMYTKEFSAESY